MPVYPAFAVYSKVDLSSCSSLPCSGSCIMLELAIAPSILRGEEASSSGRDVKDPRRIDAPGRERSRHWTFRSGLRRFLNLGPRGRPPRQLLLTCARKVPLFFQRLEDFVFGAHTLIWIKEASGQTRTSRPTSGMSAPPEDLCCRTGPVSAEGFSCEFSWPHF